MIVFTLCASSERQFGALRSFVFGRRLQAIEQARRGRWHYLLLLRKALQEPGKHTITVESSTIGW